MKKEKVTAELQLHSDQGVQYTSQGYLTLAQKYGITPSMSRRANPYYNAMAECFFAMLKTQCIYLCKPQTVAEAGFLFAHNLHEGIMRSRTTTIDNRPPCFSF